MSMIWYTNSGASSALTTGSVNTTYYAKFTFKGDDIRAIYVDWGDGTSNKKTEANYQWVQYTEPKSDDIVSHTYTQSGTFTPIVQTVNSQGIVSRYYGSGATAEVKPYTVDTSINNAIIKDSTATGIMRIENTTVKSGIDNSLFDKMGAGKLYMYIPPTVTKSELESLGSIKLTLELMIEDSLMNTGSTSSTYNLTKAGGGGSSLQTLEAHVLVSGGSAIQNGLFNLLLSGGSGAVPLNGDYNARCTRVVSARYNNCKIEEASYAQNDIFNRLKIFIVGEGSFLGKSSDGGITFYPITYLSAGSPYKSSKDAQRNVMLDFSQSRTAASNTSIDNYKYDWGKTWLAPANRWALAAGSFVQLSDSTKVTDSNVSVSYTYMPRLSVTNGTLTHSSKYRSGGTTTYYDYGEGGLNNVGAKFSGATPTANSYLCGALLDDEFNFWYISDVGRYGTTGGGATVPRGKANQFITSQFALDDYGKFYDQYHLVRTQADPATTGSDGSTLNYSVLSANQPDLVKIYGKNTDWDVKTNTTQVSAQQYAIAGVSSVLLSNSGSSHGGFNSMDKHPLANINNPLPRDVSGATVSGATDYILLILDSKTDKLFLNCSNYAQCVTQAAAVLDQNDAAGTTALEIAGLSYLKVNNANTFEQSTEWVPLEFNDETRVEREYKDDTNDKYYVSGTSFARSGYLSFDMPDDWSTSTITQLCGGRYNTPNVTAWTGSLNAMEKMITGSLAREADDTTNIGSTAKWGRSFKITTTALSYPDWNSYSNSDIGAFKYVVQLVSSNGGSVGDNVDMINTSRWVARTSGGVVLDGFVQDLATPSPYETEMYFHDGLGTISATAWEEIAGAGTVRFIVRPVNIYDVIGGVSKVYFVSGTDTTLMPEMTIDGYSTTYDNKYNLQGADDNYFNQSIGWATNDKYVLKIAIKGKTGVADLDGSYADNGENGTFPELWNIFDATQSNVGIVKEVDDSAWNLNSLPITSDISLGRSSTMYSAITRKGKVYIAKTGVGIQTMSFSSVALGDEKASGAFDDSSPYTMYGQLRTIRKLQSSSGDVYWDEQQKDGTYIRIFGVVSNVSETLGTGGPRAVLKYNFNLTIQEIALLDANGEMMTNPYPLGGIEDERSYK